jgi:hypothetical protein
LMNVLWEMGIEPDLRMLPQSTAPKWVFPTRDTGGESNYAAAVGASTSANGG